VVSELKITVKTRYPKAWDRLKTAVGKLRGYSNKIRFQARKTRFGVEAARNIAIDFRYGGYCGGRIPTRFAHLDAHGTSSADYYQLSRLFDTSRGGVKVNDDDVLVDVGAGKGRIVNFWLYRGFRNRIYALELDETFALPAAERLRKHTNVTFLCGDAIELLPEDGSFFFLFNPFGEQTMRRFKEKVTTIAEKNPSVRILYFKCDALAVFENDDRWRIERLEGFFYPGALIHFTGQPSAE
jgi:hypothetical protein